MTRRNLSTLVALQNEEPRMLIRLLRSLWPEIQAALDRGHTRKVVHERLGQAGISISYRQFCAYVARLRREHASKKGDNVSVRRSAVAGSAQDSGPDAEISGQIGGVHDPLANVRERLIRNRPGFNYDDGLPDKNKLIG